MAQIFSLLLAEDSEEDFYLMKMVVESQHWPFVIAHVENGFQAWNYLLGKPPFDDRNRFPFPELVLADIKMPYWDGFQLLKNIRSRHEFNKLPVVVMTGSDQQQDRARALDMGANAYFLKDMLLYPTPAIAAGFLSLIHSRAPAAADLLKRDAGQVPVLKG